MDRHRRLTVWQDAQSLTVEVYALTRALPREEAYVVTSQLRRAAWSVQNNIAEGNARLGRRELRRFLDIALASLAEVDSMTATLPVVYEMGAAARIHLDRIGILRQRVNRGIFAILRGSTR